MNGDTAGSGAFGQWKILDLYQRENCAYSANILGTTLLVPFALCIRHVLVSHFRLVAEPARDGFRLAREEAYVGFAAAAEFLVPVSAHIGWWTVGSEKLK